MYVYIFPIEFQVGGLQHRFSQLFPHLTLTNKFCSFLIRSLGDYVAMQQQHQHHRINWSILRLKKLKQCYGMHLLSSC